MKIITHFINPPIPIRSFDYSAVDDDTYSGEEGDLIGCGATPEEAEQALWDLMEESQ